MKSKSVGNNSKSLITLRRLVHVTDEKKKLDFSREKKNQTHFPSVFALFISRRHGVHYNKTI